MTGCELFDIIVEALMQETTDDTRIWTDGSEILCKTEAMADAIADLIDAVEGEPVAHTGSYDPEEDERNDCVDNYTGWYYVDLD